MNSDYINQIKGIENKSYIELGIGDRASFDAVRSSNKYSVDINGKADFTGTTSEFFKSLNGKKWDIIFIDADHRRDSLVFDYNNSVKRCNEWIIIHDLIPPNLRYTQDRFCSDGYMLLATLLIMGVEVYPMAENFGMTFVRMPAKLITKCVMIRYDEFMQSVKKHLYSWDEIRKVING